MIIIYIIIISPGVSGELAAEQIVSYIGPRGRLEIINDGRGAPGVVPPVRRPAGPYPAPSAVRTLRFTITTSDPVSSLFGRNHRVTTATCCDKAHCKTRCFSANLTG